MPKARIVLITGVSRGLGLAMARKFAALGHTVIGCGRSKQALNGLRKGLGSPHSISVVDVTRDAQVAKWAEQVIAEVGVPDLLLNNAALMNPVAPLWEIAWKDFDGKQLHDGGGMGRVCRALPARSQGKRQQEAIDGTGKLTKAGSSLEPCVVDTAPVLLRGAWTWVKPNTFISDCARWRWMA